MLEAPRSRKFQAILTGVLLRVGQENLPKRWTLSSALLFPLGQKWELIRHLDLHKFCSKQKYSGTGLEIWWQGGNVCDEISWNKHTEGEVSWESLTVWWPRRQLCGRWLPLFLAKNRVAMVTKMQGLSIKTQPGCSVSWEPCLPTRSPHYGSFYQGDGQLPG